jgi:hypothetical protein
LLLLRAAGAPEEQLLSLRWISCSAATSSSAVNRDGDDPAAGRRGAEAASSAMARVQWVRFDGSIDRNRQREERCGKGLGLRLISRALLPLSFL